MSSEREAKLFQTLATIGGVALVLGALGLAAVVLISNPTPPSTGVDRPVPPQQGSTLDGLPTSMAVTTPGPTASHTALPRPSATASIPTPTVTPTSAPPEATSTPTQVPSVLATTPAIVATAEPSPTIVRTPTATTVPTPLAIAIVDNAVGGYVRGGPGLNNAPIGVVQRGDQLIILGRTGGWYLVRLGTPHSDRSYITGDRGWLSRSLVDRPNLPVPGITPEAAP